MFAFVAIIFGLQAFAQVSYFLGKRTDTYPNHKVEMYMTGILSLDKTSRTWSIVRCDTPASKTCISYKYRLFKDKDEKYYLEKPGAPGTLSVTPAKVEEDHLKLRKFITAEKLPNGASYQMEHLTLGQNFMWKVISKSPNGMITEIKTTFETVAKESYDSFIKGKNIEAFELKKP